MIETQRSEWFFQSRLRNEIWTQVEVKLGCCLSWQHNKYLDVRQFLAPGVGLLCSPWREYSFLCRFLDHCSPRWVFTLRGIDRKDHSFSVMVILYALFLLLTAFEDAVSIGLWLTPNKLNPLHTFQRTWIRKIWIVEGVGAREPLAFPRYLMIFLHDFGSHLPHNKKSQWNISLKFQNVLVV